MAKGVKKLFYSFILGGSALLLGYLARLYLAREISISEFGMYYSILGFVQLLTIATNLGLGSAQMKYISTYLENIKKANGIAIFPTAARVSIAAIIFLILFIGSKFFALKYLGNETNYQIIIFGGILLVVITAYNSLSRANNGFLRMNLSAFSEFLVKAIFLSSILITALTVKNLLVMTILSYLASTLLLAFPISRSLSKGIEFTKKMYSEIFTYSKHSLLTQAGYLIIGNLDIVMLTMMSSLESVAIYSVVLPSTMALASVGKISHGVIMPLVSRKWAEKDDESIKKIAIIINKYSLFFVLPIILLVLTMPKIFLRIFFGNTYVVGSVALQILTIGVFLLTISMNYQSILTGTTKAKQVTKIIAYGAILNILLNIFLIPKMGFTGAAIATTLAYTLMSLLSLKELSAFLEIRKIINQFLLFLIPSAIFLLSVNLIRLLDMSLILKLIIGGILGATTYLIACQLTKAVTLQDIKEDILNQLSK